MTSTGRRAIGPAFGLVVALSVAACGLADAPLETQPVTGIQPTPSTAPPGSSPGATEPVVVPEGCPQPNEPIRAAEFQRFGNSRCFPAGVSITGWWEQAADGGVTFGPRPASVAVRLHGSDAIRVNLRSGESLPASVGFGLLFAPTVRDGTELGMVLINARITELENPATSCPTGGPIPVAVFLQSLTSCFEPNVDVQIAGYRDTLDGLCGCGPMGYFERPEWLTSPYGFGWLFAQPASENLDDLVTLYAPDEHALGADSGARPTWMEVTGHFGDPAASTCKAVPDPNADPDLAITDAEAKELTKSLVRTCATRFVVTSIRETTAPT